MYFFARIASKTICAGLAMAMISACKEVDSIPVFDDGRLTVETLTAVQGLYISSDQSIQIQRASTDTDLLSWVWLDDKKQQVIGRGNAVASRVPSSNLMLALLLDVQLTGNEGEITGGPGFNQIAFVRIDGPDNYRFIGVGITGFLGDMIEAVSDPEVERKLILSYVRNHAELIASWNGVDYIRQTDTPQIAPAPPAAPSGPSPEDVARDRARQQCQAEVSSRLLYCDEQVDYSGFSTTYVIDCPGGSRSEKRECRGWYNESTYPNVGFDPYYCDPQTDVRGGTADQVVSQVCQ